MPQYEIRDGGTILRVWYSIWNGWEKIWHNDQLVSEKNNFFHPVSVHEFTVQNGVDTDTFEIRNAGPVGYFIRKNGSLIAEKHRGWLRYLFSVGIMYAFILSVYFGWVGAEYLFGWEPLEYSRIIRDEGAVVAFVLGIFMSIWFKKQLVGKSRPSS